MEKHPHDQWSTILDKAIKMSQRLVSLCILFTILALLIFLIREVYDLFIAFPTAKDRKILHDIAFLLVIIKAYRVLLSYLQNGYVSVKYLVEISIIAPAIEVVFAADRHSVPLNVLFAGFAGFNLVVYILLHQQIMETEEREHGKAKVIR